MLNVESKSLFYRIHVLLGLPEILTVLSPYTRIGRPSKGTAVTKRAGPSTLGHSDLLVDTTSSASEPGMKHRL